MQDTLQININSYDSYAIRVADVVWSKAILNRQFEQQKESLTNLVNASGYGLILDCSLVELGNSELINLLMSVRNYAKKSNKYVVLINVPTALRQLIQLCRLQSVLPSAADASEAKTMITGLAAGKGNLRLWIESHWVLSTFIAVALAIAAALMAYRQFG